MNLKMRTQNWKTKNSVIKICCGELKIYKYIYKGYNIECKHYLYAFEKELCKSIFNSAIQKTWAYRNLKKKLPDFL